MCVGSPRAASRLRTLCMRQRQAAEIALRSMIQPPRTLVRVNANVFQ